MAIDVAALIAAQKQELDSVKPLDQEVLLGGEKVTVRLWPLSGKIWRDLCAKHPNRPDSPFDQALGYDLDSLLWDYPKVYLVDGDEVTDVAESWADICAVLSGPDLKNLAYAIWGMNEYDPAQKLAAAGKASAGKGRKKRS